MIKFTKITEEDLEFVNEVRNECVEFLHDSNTFSLEQTKEWFKNTNPLFYVIWAEDIRIGYFRTSNYSKQNNNIYIGADIHKNYRGMGYGYLSYIQFIPFLFEELKLNKISLEVLESNNRAYSLYLKVGFSIVALKKEDVYKNGKYENSILMSILKKDLKKLQRKWQLN